MFSVDSLIFETQTLPRPPPLFLNAGRGQPLGNNGEDSVNPIYNINPSTALSSTAVTKCNVPYCQSVVSFYGQNTNA